MRNQRRGGKEKEEEGAREKESHVPAVSSQLLSASIYSAGFFAPSITRVGVYIDSVYVCTSSLGSYSYV